MYAVHLKCDVVPKLKLKMHDDIEVCKTWYLWKNESRSWPFQVVHSGPFLEMLHTEVFRISIRVHMIFSFLHFLNNTKTNCNHIDNKLWSHANLFVGLFDSLSRSGFRNILNSKRKDSHPSLKRVNWSAKFDKCIRCQAVSSKKTAGARHPQQPS